MQLGCGWWGAGSSPGLHSHAVPAQSALLYCVYIQPETQSAKQPQLMFWNGLFQGLGGFWGGVFYVLVLEGLVVFIFKGLMLTAGITSFTSQSL